MPVARSSAGNVDTLVLPVLWMASYLHTVGHIEACRYHYSELRHCAVVRRLTPLLRRVVLVASYLRRWRAPRLVRRARDVGTGACNAPIQQPSLSFSSPSCPWTSLASGVDEPRRAAPTARPSSAVYSVQSRRPAPINALLYSVMWYYLPFACRK